MEDPPQSLSPKVYSLDEDYAAPRALSSPEKKLLLAILRRAIWDFALYRDPEDPNHELHLDATGWLFWEGEEEMTFRYICVSLGLNPLEIRDAALNLTRNRIKRISKRIESDE